MALQAARSIRDPAQLRGLQRALAGHALAAVERSALAVDAQGGDPAGAAERLRAVLAPLWLFEGALDPAQARRVDELERRFRR